MIHLDLIELVGGLIYLLAGADLLVRGAVALARKAQVSPLVVALTVVALGTSLPEFIVAIQALLTGYPGILLGNVVGSNVANVLLVGGLTAAVYPVAPGDDAVRRDAAVMVALSLVFAGLCVTTGLDRVAGTAFVLGMVGVLFVAGRDALRAKRDIAEGTPLEWVLGLPSSP
ncbi:MAG: sodium:calcium antiporter, partial [Gemmatimonadetes bacterium]|nr:sodium:calcium antiporter [Gemmatimonadota bacterium]NIR77605.1 sodium:calcium antiporter [Gemmatimonadota bacterium]NIT86160.1 sodium:calcium antiporter [Gemmatimonadota bacterium]NIU29974.1 sodium:calcium antiporter [Gemmatimonadota bacterium]NIU34939.1 sodium:calcium antiporter [Gemmatimonadota bacterium]